MNWLACSRIAMVSVVVSIHMRKMFVEVRKMFLNAQYAEQDVRVCRRFGGRPSVEPLRGFW
jgi:hypothetical protein